MEDKKRRGRPPIGRGIAFPARIEAELVKEIRRRAVYTGRTVRQTAERIIRAGIEQTPAESK